MNEKFKMVILKQEDLLCDLLCDLYPCLPMIQQCLLEHAGYYKLDF